MKTFFNILLGVVTAVVLVAAFASVSEARGGHGGHFRGRGSVHIGGYYDPWYDPFYYNPMYPQYPPAGYYYVQPPDYGYLKTSVEPNAAEVLVDGKLFGHVEDFDGPVNHLKLPLGVHEVQFRMPGYRSYTVNFTVTPGDTTEVRYDLTALPGDSGGGWRDRR